MKRINQLEGALGRKTLENEILKEPVDFAKEKKVDCAIASIARGRAVRAVCQVIANVVQKHAAYGYRRVWARLRLDGHIVINHKRVYRVMRDAGLLLFRQGQKPLDSRKHEAKWPPRKSTHVGVQTV